MKKTDEHAGAPRPSGRNAAGDTGNKFDNVKSVERDADGNIVRQPGDVRYVRDEIAPADEAARERGEV